MTVTPPKVEEAVQRMLDEGTNPSDIRATLALVLDGYCRDQLPAIVDRLTLKWLSATEYRLQQLASDESWQRLESLLIKYRKVVNR